MLENKENLVTLKIQSGDREWVKDEQRRIQKAEGDEPTHAELFHRLRVAYEVDTATQQSSRPVELPGPFAGLTDDQIWLINNVIEIFRDQPQASIYRAMENTIQLAVKEHRKTRQPNRHAKTSTHDQRRTGGGI
jgi:hypothetical protein